MPNLPQRSLRIFQLAGIAVYLHWSWFLVALIEIEYRTKGYSSLIWNMLEYLALFLIVLTHEFGHALACRQVGGTANQIVLWPLGGVAYVDPPQRPGATLWSIAAGPLVNVALLVGLWLLGIVNPSMSLLHLLRGNDHPFVLVLWKINVGLLVFNLLPIYPLDGGQILRSLLWFVIGRAHSLMAAVVVGFIGVLGLVLVAFWMRSVWIGIIAFFILANCWGGLKQARVLARQARLPRRPGYACPSCRTAPPMGAYWKCSHCGTGFDTFQTQARCPTCGTEFPATMCLDCRTVRPMREWASYGSTSEQGS